MTTRRLLPTGALRKALVHGATTLLAATIVWLPPALLVTVAGYLLHATQPVSVPLLGLAVGWGITLAPAAAVGSRVLPLAAKRRPTLARPLAAVGFTACGGIWWAVTVATAQHCGLPDLRRTQELGHRSVIPIGLAVLLFAAGEILRQHLNVVKGKLNAHRQWQAECRRREAFELLPKACLAGSDGTDPRYSLPNNLPLAVGLLAQDMQAYTKANREAVQIEVDPLSSFPNSMVVEPAVLCAAVEFAAEYVLQRTKRRAELLVRYQAEPRPSVQIDTNAPAGDLWFALPTESAAHLAKVRLLQALNRFADKGARLEAIETSAGHLALRIWTRAAPQDYERVWTEIDTSLFGRARRLPRTDRSQGTGAVWLGNDIVYKAQILGQSAPKALTLTEEYTVLRRLDGLPGIPQVVDYHESRDYALLACSRMAGVPLDQYLEQTSFSRMHWFRAIADLSALLRRVHERGVAHRDLRPDNVLVDCNGRVSLIDFDQAVVVDAHDAAQIDTFGKTVGSIRPCVSFRTLIKFLQLEGEYNSVVSELTAAWAAAARSDASSPGQNIAYYNWSWGDQVFPGERDWYFRWSLIQRELAEHLCNATVLDLGCNQGLLAVYCMLYGAQSVTAVDRDPTILAAAASIAAAAGTPITFLQGDLESSDFVEKHLLDQDYDLVIALSLLHWLTNPGPALCLLTRAKVLLYEGHDALSAEVAFLEKLGFTRIRVLGYSERLRPLFIATRCQSPEQPSNPPCP